jgi:hypothetical protein
LIRFGELLVGSFAVYCWFIASPTEPFDFDPEK